MALGSEKVEPASRQLLASHSGVQFSGMSSGRDGVGRWWIYFQERFPLFAHGPLILAFSLSAVCFSSLLRGSERWPAWPVIAVALLSSLLSFLHLRLADEFKDLDEDTRYRPYRPVPRGLVTLRELGALWVATGLIQLALAVFLNFRLVPLLAVTWLYLGLMSREFFCRAWLKSHPFTYMWTHMFILPLVDFYATSCDWLSTSGRPPAGLYWFVLVSFLNGFLIEIGRKIRAPDDEEAGVGTYSVLWGRRGAVRGWLFAMALTGGAAVVAAGKIGFILPVAVVLGIFLAVSAFIGSRFVGNPRTGKSFELLSGLWTLCLYLLLGVIPLVWKVLA